MSSVFSVFNRAGRKIAFATIPFVTVGIAGIAYNEEVSGRDRIIMPDAFKSPIVPVKDPVSAAPVQVLRELKEGKDGKDVHADPDRGTLPVRKFELSDGFESYRPDPEVWVRVDELVMESPSFKPFIRNNVVHDTLVGQGMLEKYEIYQKVKHSHPEAPVHEVMCLVHCGKSLNGHPGVVHGGIVSMLFDNCFGWVFLASKINPGFTANLNVNFRKPCMAGATVIINAKLVEQTDRKRYLTATMRSAKEDVLLAESTSLFVVPRASTQAKL